MGNKKIEVKEESKIDYIVVKYQERTIIMDKNDVIDVLEGSQQAMVNNQIVNIKKYILVFPNGEQWILDEIDEFSLKKIKKV